MLRHRCGKLRTRGEVELGEEVGEMRLHGPTRYVEPVADLRIGESVGDQAGHRVLGRGEAAPAGLRPAAGSPATAVNAGRAQDCFSAGEVAGGAEPFVDLNGLI